MNVQVKALDSFAHGRVSAHRNETVTLNKGDAEELAKLGLVEILDDKAPAAEAKMEDAPKNKMADAPTNKASTKKAG